MNEQTRLIYSDTMQRAPYQTEADRGQVSQVTVAAGLRK